MEATPILHPLVKREPPPPIPPTGQEGDDEQVRLAEQLADREDIPVDVAYSIINRHPAARMRGVYERP